MVFPARTDEQEDTATIAIGRRIRARMGRYSVRVAAQLGYYAPED
jgi:hypothetical protein